MSRVLFDADTHALSHIHNRAAVLAVTQAACTPFNVQLNLSLYEAVGDVLRLQEHVEDLPLNPRRWTDRRATDGGVHAARQGVSAIRTAPALPPVPRVFLLGIGETAHQLCRATYRLRYHAKATQTA